MSKKITPYGNRILCKRRVVGNKLGSGLLVAPDETAGKATDIADVVAIPDHTFFDKELVGNAEAIAKKLSVKASEGDVDAVKALIEFNAYIRVKSLKVGDTIFISRYIGTDFFTSESQESYTIVNAEDIIAKVEIK